MEFEHPSHKHPLILYEDPKDWVQQLNCYGCLLPLSGRPTYKCTQQQCNFLLHKSCAQLPNKIIHFLHPRHPLTLFSKSPYREGFAQCDSCDEKIWGFAYHCSLCKFDLDIKCTLLQQPIVEHEGHQHEFKLFRPISFTCDACGETDNNGMSYLCSTCQLCVHKNCASLPDTIKQIGHDHPLSLLHTIQIDHPILEELCKICSLKVDTRYWCYYCASCNYIVHLNCATSMHLNKDVDDKPDQSLSMSVVSEGLRSLSLDVETERVTELEHFSHPHLLTLIDVEPEQSEKCDGCAQVISVPFYNCAQCNFFLHVTCAELPSTILHPLHPHLLTLLEKSDMTKYTECDACTYEMDGGIHYYCCDCEFFLCVRCTSLSNTLRHDAHEHILNLVQKVTRSICNACGSNCETKFRCEDCDFNLCLSCAVLSRMEFEHPSHKHPLILYEDPKDCVQQLNCYGCLLPLSGRPTYKCTQQQQCNFVLHKSCAQLPNKIIHFLHPKHPLTLFSMSSYRNHKYVACGNCDERIWGFIYHCSLCKFNLDIKCTLLQQPIVEHEGHQHSFMLCRPTSFTCDACGETDNNGMSYFCSTCQLWVHKNCASLPDTIKQIGHDHPLSLLHTIQIDQPILEELCKICSLKVDTHYWCYYCASCNYIVHLNCATSMHLNKDVDDKTDPSLSMSVVSKGLRSLSMSVVSKGLRSLSLDVETERVTEIEHFSHQHLLTLIDVEPEQSKKCNGCRQVISVPFYNCALCNFFLHVTCAEVPSTILLPLHPHLLTLLEKSDRTKITPCGACDCGTYGGIYYYCCDCNFFLCVSCTSLSNTLRHDGHEHILNLVQKVTRSICNACGRGCCTKFRCEDCDFNLCLKCAVLSRKFRHRWDKHPLKLTFYSVENELGEYDCEICEGVGDRNHWFYHCEDCDFSAHPYCLLHFTPPDRMSTTHIYSVHPKDHVLSVVFVKNQRILCDICGDICKRHAVKCGDCNSCFHLAGFCSPESG